MQRCFGAGVARAGRGEQEGRLRRVREAEARGARSRSKASCAAQELQGGGGRTAPRPAVWHDTHTTHQPNNTCSRELEILAWNWKIFILILAYINIAPTAINRSKYVLGGGAHDPTGFVRDSNTVHSITLTSTGIIIMT